MYKYSDGTIRNATTFVYNDIQYGIDVFEKWTPEQLAEIGVKKYREDGIPFGYRSGVPVDIETDILVHRTYPNPIFEYDNMKTSYMTLINEHRKSKEEDGFVFDVNATNVFIDTDIKGSLRMTQMALVFQNNPTHVETWKAKDPITKNHKWFDLNATLYASIQLAGQQYVRECFMRQEALQKELELLEKTPELYISFGENINTGWPS